jgi:hypothetical protein
VGGVERAVGADEVGEERALVAGLGDGGDAAEEQRVVDEQEVGVGGDRLVHGRADGVDGQVDPPHGSPRIAADEAGCVPAGCAGGGPRALDGSDGVGEGGGHVAHRNEGAVRARRASAVSCCCDAEGARRSSS